MTRLRTCRGCGCDDDHACLTSDGPCSWVLLDISQPTGVCSVCAEDLGWHPRALATVGRSGLDDFDEEAA